MKETRTNLTMMILKMIKVMPKINRQARHGDCIDQVAAYPRNRADARVGSQKRIDRTSMAPTRGGATSAPETDRGRTTAPPQATSP